MKIMNNFGPMIEICETLSLTGKDPRRVNVQDIIRDFIRLNQILQEYHRLVKKTRIPKFPHYFEISKDIG